jgi:deoxyribodipyrimidine photo-lyase
MRENVLHAEYTTKLSPYLSNGCLSVRKVYFAVDKWEKDRGSRADSLIDRLFKIDFYKFYCMKHSEDVVRELDYNREALELDMRTHDWIL